jgi:hypothetical protein
MTKRVKLALLLTVVLNGLSLTGCDYVPRHVYEIETKDGKTLKLLCPTLDLTRSKFTYIIDGECVLTN